MIVSYLIVKGDNYFIERFPNWFYCPIFKISSCFYNIPIMCDYLMVYAYESHLNFIVKMKGAQSINFFNG